MVMRMWVDRRKAQAGAFVALVGLLLLLATQGLPAEVGDPNCASVASPDRARECVAEKAQMLDRQRLVSIGAVALTVSIAAVGGALVLRARRRVMELDEAGELLETDLAGIRSLIAGGVLMSYESQGRTRVDAIDVEKASQGLRVANRSARPGAV